MSLAEVIERLGGRAISVHRAAGLVVEERMARLTVRLDDEKDPPTFVSTTFPTELGAGVRILSWGDLRKVGEPKPLDVEEDSDTSRLVQPPPVGLPFASVESAELTELLQRYGPIARAAYAHPSLRYVRLEPVASEGGGEPYLTDVVASTGYQLGHERTGMVEWVAAKPRTIALSGAMVDSLVKALATVDGPVVLSRYDCGIGSNDRGYMVEVDGIVYWCRALLPYWPDGRMWRDMMEGQSAEGKVGTLRLTSADLGRIARTAPVLADTTHKTSEWSRDVEFVRLELPAAFGGVDVASLAGAPRATGMWRGQAREVFINKRFITAAAQQLRGKVVAEFPEEPDGVVTFRDDHGARHLLCPHRGARAHAEHMEVRVRGQRRTARRSREDMATETGRGGLGGPGSDSPSESEKED